MQRVPFGLEKFDALIEGGFPEGSVILVSGNSGAGKTQFSASFLYYGAISYGDVGLYVTIEERAEKIKYCMQRLGLDLGYIEDQGYLLIFDIAKFRAKVKEFKLRLDKLREGLETLFKKFTIKRFVLDSLTPFALGYKRSEDFRAGLFDFVDFLRSKNVVALLITELKESSDDISRFGLEEYLADGVVLLRFKKEGINYSRTINVRKMRYTNHDTREFRLKITSEGLDLIEDETAKKLKDLLKQE
jgi:KaiC/GvpD/RAD55 family RecA-like ATPase